MPTSSFAGCSAIAPPPNRTQDIKPADNEEDQKSVLPLLEAAVHATGVTSSAIEDAKRRLQPVAHLTPIFTSHLLDLWLSGTSTLHSPDATTQTTFFFKAECLQRTGSFKFRGAYNAIAHLSECGDMRPIVTHSSGNHGQAIAAAAQLQHRHAIIVVPERASAAKVDAIAAYGAQISRCAPGLSERQRAADEVVRETGGVQIHPFLHGDVVAGQATVGDELIDQVTGLDAVVVAVGGGGLLAGVTLAIKRRMPHVVVVGAEPELSAGAARSLAAGRHVSVDDAAAARTVADGVRAGVGTLGWQVVSRLVDDVITVSEEDILCATQMVWERLKLVVEPAAGVAVAAARSRRFVERRFRRVAIVLCGGNVDTTEFFQRLRVVQ